MSDPVELNPQPGMPVEIGQIGKELGKLWESNDDTKTRASLINLAIYTEDAESVGANTELISQIAQEHACRALLIIANHTATEPRVRAWINAHCPLAGKRQICSEQITFQIDGETSQAVTSIVFSHLDSDLPLCFWRQGEFREPLNRELWRNVDRLIFDSRTWENPGKQFDLACRIGKITEGRTVLCDLNWTRLVNARFALASLFDHSSALPHLAQIDSVEITHAPGNRMTALLLLGWLANQLGWKLHDVLSSRFFTAPNGTHVNFELKEAEGAFISRCVLRHGEATFEMTRECGSDFFGAHMYGGDVPDTVQMLNAGRKRLTDVLVTELSRGGRHPLYPKSVEAIRAML
jgi:glucose-6-phosphate dehydrogenase assembly protein OpcA